MIEPSVAKVAIVEKLGMGLSKQGAFWRTIRPIFSNARNEGKLVSRLSHGAIEAEVRPSLSGWWNGAEINPAQVHIGVEFALFEVQRMLDWSSRIGEVRLSTAVVSSKSHKLRYC